jgi:methionyl-tRNA formyltransferase
MARVAFLGSPEPAVQSLRALVEAGHDVALVVSSPDKRRGRGTATSPTPVKALAAELGIPVSEHVLDVLEVGAELGVVVAFGRLIRPAVLDHLLMVNVHFSLLPRWRGAAPVERAMLAGDERTGVCLMRLEEGLDTGPVYACTETVIHPKDTSVALLHRLSSLGADLLVSQLADGVSGLGTPRSQQGVPTYAAKITPEDLHIDWSAPAGGIERQVRVGKAWTTFRTGRVIIWEAAASAFGPMSRDMPPLAAADRGLVSTGDGRVAVSVRPPGTIVNGLVATGSGWLELSVVQPEGRQRQPAGDWLRGARVLDGEAFST